MGGEKEAREGGSPAMVSLRNAWAAYGPARGALPSDSQGTLQGLEKRKDLNGATVTVKWWDGLSGRFVVELRPRSSDGATGQAAAAAAAAGERIKVLASSIWPRSREGLEELPSCWASQGSSDFGPLPVAVALAVASFLQVRAVGAFSGAARALRSSLWLSADAELLWQALLDRGLGPLALETAKGARRESGATGPTLHRCARGLRQIFRESIEIIKGAVTEQTGNAEVVVCPCVCNMRNANIGAQAAVRRAAGPELEKAISVLEKPVPALSVTLLPGGTLARKVAMAVTEPPEDVIAELHERSLHSEQLETLMSFLDRLHANMLEEVRARGFRSLAMPVLCTGGMGIPVHLVAIAALRAAHNDFLAHPTDALRIRIACYEANHLPHFNMIKDEALHHFFSPEEWRSHIMSLLIENEPRRDMGIF